MHPTCASQSSYTRRALLVWAGIFAAYFLLTLLIGLFHTLHADELLLAFTASEVARGRVPGIDFLTQEPFAFFAPFALAYKLLSPSIEAERLVLAAMTASANCAMTAVVWRHRGRDAAVAAFLLLALNVPFLANFSILNAQGPSYFGLCGAFAAVMLPRRPDWRHYALAGLFVGFALSSRLAVSLAAIALAAHAAFTGGPWNFRRAAGRVTAAALAAALVTIPDVLIVLKDPANLLYIRAGVSADMAKQAMGIEYADSILAISSSAHLRAYGNYFLQADYHSRYQNLLFPMALAAVVLYGLAARMSGAVPRLGSLGRDVGWATAFATALVTGYGLTWMQYPGYYKVTYPFTVVIMVGLVHTLLTRVAESGPQWVGLRRGLTGLLVLVLAGHSLQGAAHGVWQLAFRNFASLGQPQTINRAACWIERATNPSDQILTGSPIIAMIAGRTLPEGFESSSTIKHWWGDLPPERQIGLPMLRPAELQQVVADGKVAIIIDDDQLSPITQEYLPEFSDLLAKRYVRIGTIGGTLFPLTFHAERGWLAQQSKPLPPLPEEENTVLRADLLRRGQFREAANALSDDIARSAATLPRDLGGAWARLTGADWNARCGQYFRG